MSGKSLIHPRPRATVWCRILSQEVALDCIRDLMPENKWSANRHRRRRAHAMLTRHNKQIRNYGSDGRAKRPGKVWERVSR